MVSLDDEKAKHIADALGNNTSKKILKYLADRETSESQIASALKMNLNTVEYNLNKLVKAGFVVKAGKFFWSEKGKKIEMYKLANKSILISTRSTLAKSILPVAAITGLLAYIIYFFTGARQFASEEMISKGADEAVRVMTAAGEMTASSYFASIPTYMWFLLGAWLALVIFLIWNFKKL